MGETKELVERLRAMCVDWNAQPMDDGELPRIEPHCRDLREAADAITALLAERDALAKAAKPFADDPDGWTVDTVNALRKVLNPTVKDNG
jgi:hypothetical protein